MTPNCITRLLYMYYASGEEHGQHQTIQAIKLHDSEIQY